jgi:predicted AlkP superfamily phosphohydrolase/phosphomutase
MNKVFIIGIDGGSPVLIDAWKEELPNFKKIMEQGIFTELKTTIPPWTCPAWNSFATGKNPGKLGTYSWDYIVPPSQPQLSNLSMSNYTTFWDLLSKAGKHANVIHVPMTYPPKAINGVMISGFPVLGAKRLSTYPEGLSREIGTLVKDWGPEPNVIAPGYDFMRGGTGSFLKEIDRHIEKTTRVTKYLMQKYPWDAFVTVFTASDRIEHNFWHFMDKNHPAHPPEVALSLSNGILNTYKKIDKTVGEFLSMIDKDTYLLIMSDHGFGPLEGVFYINNWLMEKGFLTLYSETTTGTKRSLLSRLIEGEGKFFGISKNILARLGLFEAGVKFIERFGEGKMTAVQQPNLELFNRVDWSKSRAFGLEDNSIYLNMHKLTDDVFK